MTSNDAYEWVNTMSTYKEVNTGIAGKSKFGRPIYFMDIDQSPDKKQETVAIFSRLHPPEITGYVAMKSFVETIMDTSELARLFRDRYRIVVYPMVNPDGVDLGHWRHNGGGIDINRDWAYYNQEEPNVVANHLVNLVKEQKNKVVLGLDFHSTQEDLYYTLTDNRQTNIKGFKDVWLEAIDAHFENYTPQDEPYDLNQPISKAWFYLQFGAESVTYEVGDETPRDFVKEKAKIAAIEMMKLLVLRDCR